MPGLWQELDPLLHDAQAGPSMPPWRAPVLTGGIGEHRVG